MMGCGRRLGAIGLVLLVGGGLSSPPPLAAPIGEEIKELNVTLDEDHWRLFVPFTGRWNSWSKSNPARIVIDLMGARSKLPGAPGLYTIELEEGPVRIIRTNQYSSEASQRRVRITLIMTEAVRYDAIRDGEGVDIRIKRPEGAVWGAPWEVVVTPETDPFEHIHPTEVEPTEEEGPTEEELAAAAARAAELERAAAEAAEVAKPVAWPTEPETPPAGMPDPVAEALKLTQAIEWQPAEHPLTEAALESLFSDTTLFDTGPRRMHHSWDVAAARLLEEAQEAYLVGDTATCLDRLLTSDRFYADTDPGRQATLLRHLLLQSWGRVVEADLGPRAPREGPWLLLADDVLNRLVLRALAADDMAFAEKLLTVWRQTDPQRTVWAKRALQLANSLMDKDQGARAAGWIRQALGADPQLLVSARPLMLLAMAQADQGAWKDAEALLRRAEKTADGDLKYRARTSLADLHYRRGQYDQAIGVYQGLLEEGVPAVERQWALYQLGVCAEAKGDLDEAKSYWGRVVDEGAGGFWVPFARTRLARLEGEERVATRRP